MASKPKVKVVVLGETAVGKTCLVLRFVKGTFDENGQSTIGVSFLSRSVQASSGEGLDLEIWDTAGQEAYRSILPLYYRGAGVVVLVFSVTEPSSFKEAGHWVGELRKTCTDPNVVVALVGNKADLLDERKVSTEEAQAYAESNDFIYVETSAKSGAGVDDLFRRIADRVEERGIRGQGGRRVRKLHLRQNNSKGCCA